MIVDSVDREILEYFLNLEPWRIACGELLDESGEPKDLPERIERLVRAGALAVAQVLGTTEEPSARNLRTMQN
jgi:hypothetical protein